MAERSAISQSVRLGVETTPGTGVAATRRLGSIGISLSTDFETEARRPIGQKYANTIVAGKEAGKGSISGSPCYTELPYLFASIISTPTTQVMLDGATPTGAVKWTFDSSAFDADTPKTYTVEQGDSVRAHRATYGLIHNLTIEASREEVTLDGEMMTHRLEDGITLSAGATMLEQVPVRPDELSLYVDTSAASLGTTKMLRAFSGMFEIGGDRFMPVWVLDSARKSYAAHVEGEPEVTFSTGVQADAQGMQGLTRLRSGETAFLRLHAVGPVIYGSGAAAIRHEMIVDCAGQVSEMDEFDEEDGVFGTTFTYGTVVDPTWARAFRVTVITTTSAL